MRVVSAEALLLAVTDLQDRDRIVTFLTREHGKVRGVARGARRKYSRFAGQLQPLAKVKVTWFEKEGRELVRISGVELVRLPTKLQSDLEGILLGSYLAEHLVEFAQENEPAELYFRLLDSTLAALAAGIGHDLAARYFEAWVLRLAGIFPAPRECPVCGRPFGPAGAVLPGHGEGLICADCATAGPPGEAGSGGMAVDAEVLELLARIGVEGLPQLAERPPGPTVLARLAEVTARVRRGFLQRELKSLRVMQRSLAG